jgi:TP901 family phage tail tape measure protein
MRNIQSVGRQTEEELSALSDTFVRMSTDATVTRDSALNLANAFQEIQGSGFEGADAMTVLEAATKAASAGLTETEVAVSGLTAVLNSYGKSADEAAEISDLMFKTVDRGVGSYEQLSSSMSNVTGTAALVGLEFDQVSAAMATMSKQGASFADSSVQLNRVLLAFLKPTEDMADAIRAAGFESGEAMIQQLGLAGALEAVTREGEAAGDSLVDLFGTVQGLRGAAALTGAGAQTFAEDLEAMGDASGAASEAFAIQMQSFAAQFDVFKNTLNAFLIQVGQVLLPVLSQVLNALMPFLTALANAPQPIQTAIVAIGALLAALGPLLLIIGQILTAWSAVSALFAGGGVLAGAGSAILAFVTGPVGVLLAALAAVAVAVILIGSNWEEVKQVMTNVGVTISQLAQIAEFGFGELLRRARTSLDQLVQILKTLATNLVQGLSEGIRAKATEFVNAIRDMAQRGLQAIRNILGIRSPSREMAKVAEQALLGFTNVFDAANPVSLPPIAGGGGAGGAGGGLVFTGDIILAGATPDQQAGEFLNSVGKILRQNGIPGR